MKTKKYFLLITTWAKGEKTMQDLKISESRLIPKMIKDGATHISLTIRECSPESYKLKFG